MPENGHALGPSPPLPDLRPRRLLRQLAGPPRHEARPPHPSPGGRVLRARRALGLVLRRSGKNCLSRSGRAVPASAREVADASAFGRPFASLRMRSRGRSMAEHDLHAIAFPKLDEAQLAALGRCPLTRRKHYRDGEALFEAGDRDPKFFVIKSGEVEIVDESGEPPKTVTVHRPGRVHRRRGAADRRPGDRQRRRPGRLRSLRGVARRPAAAPEQPPGPGRRHPAGVHRPAATPARVGRLHGPARDRLALLAGHLPGPRLPGQEPGAVHLAGPGGRPAGEASCSSSSG